MLRLLLLAVMVFRYGCKEKQIRVGGLEVEAISREGERKGDVFTIVVFKTNMESTKPSSHPTLLYMGVVIMGFVMYVPCTV